MIERIPTDREIECVQAIANGLTAKQASFKLDTSINLFNRLLERAMGRRSAADARAPARQYGRLRTRSDGEVL